VIASATGNVAGGTVLLKMANLDTVQVRALVDETDIGKLAAGLDVSITVDAYPNRRFAGQVLKIEPQSIVQQNVTLFPVLVRLPNPDHLLRPGMNAEIAITVGERRQVVAVPNGALRTQRDVASAAGVIGLSMDDVQAQLAAAQAKVDSASGQTTLGGAARTGAESAAGKSGDMITLPDGRQIVAPAGVDAKQANAVFAKMQSGGGFQSLTDEDRQVLRQLRESGALGGGGTGGGGSFRMTMRAPDGPTSEGPGGVVGGRLARSERRQQQAGLAFGGDFIVFVNRGGQATAVTVRTGLTDLDYSEVVSGLTEQDSVLILPSASLIASQQEFQNMRNRMGGGLVPGMRQGSGGGGGVQVRIGR
jgi:HlyD family secretion protein